MPARPRTPLPLPPLALALLLGLAGPARAQEFGPAYPLSAGFMTPAGIGVDPLGARVLVSDTFAHRVRTAPLASLAAMSPSWGEFGYVADLMDPARLRAPQGVAADGAGAVYLTDGPLVRRYQFDALSDSYLLDPAFESATGSSAAGVTNRPLADVAVADGRVFALDGANNRVLVASAASPSAWAVWREDPGFGGPAGLDVSPDGATVYLASAGLSQVLVVPASGPWAVLGGFGSDPGRFNQPRDVARLPDGRLAVADRLNHRVQLIRPDGGFDSMLGEAPLFTSPQHLAYRDGQLFVSDSDANRIVAFLGSGAPASFDLYLRDALSDPGDEPSGADLALASPDILVRHHPDVDPVAAARDGLSSLGFEQPLPDQNNYVYVAVHNRGDHEATGLLVHLFWADPAGALAFPSDYRTDHLYESYSGPASELNSPNYALAVPYVPARSAAGDGVVVVGPLIYRPVAPSTTNGMQDLALLARLVSAGDPTPSGDGLTAVRASNNVALHPIHVAAGPAPTGPQDLLVIRASFPGMAPVDSTTVEARVAGLDRWLSEVSYQAATLHPVERETTLAVPAPGDYQQAAVELAEYVLSRVHTDADPVLDGPTADPADDIDRVLIVVSDPAFHADWATTGPWPFRVGGRTRYLSVSIQGQDNSDALYRHGLAHQLGLGDLYLYPEVSFEDPVQLPWGYDVMMREEASPHPLVYSKQAAGWVTAAGGRIAYLPRQAATPGPAIDLAYQATLQSGQVGAVAVGLTPGITAIEEEHHFYVLEARSPMVGASETTVPADGVLLYSADTRIPQGHGPVLLQDATPTTVSPADAFIPLGGSLSVPGAGLRVQVPARTADGFSVQVDYDPPPDRYDLYLEPGDPEWMSPDIWIDNRRDGDTSGPDGFDPRPAPGDEQPLGGDRNRIYARVHNRGPQTAYDVEVQFLLSDPYHVGAGDVGQFDVYRSVIVPEIPPGMYADAFVSWTPLAHEDPHSCVKVQLLRLTGELSPEDTTAQRNFAVRPADHGSPYDVVEFGMQLRNPTPGKQKVYFREEGLPDDWSRSTSFDSVDLLPGDQVVHWLKFQPSEGTPDCKVQRLQLTAWTPEGDTLVRLGGTTVDVPLGRHTKLPGLSAKFLPRDPKLCPNGTGSSCDRVRVQGCTVPARPYGKVAVGLRAPGDVPAYSWVASGADGCFETEVGVAGGGDYQVGAYYPGDGCNGRASAEVPLSVPLKELAPSQPKEQDGYLLQKEGK